MLRFFYLVVKVIKNSRNSDASFRKSIIVVFEIAVLLTLTIVIVAVLKGNISLEKDKPLGYVTTSRLSESNTGYKDAFILPTTDKWNVITSSYETGSYEPQINNNAPATQIQNAHANALPDPSGWGKAQIVSKAKDAVNKTKAYTANLTVNHSESFNANVTECSAGGIVKTVVDLMIGWVVKPVDEVLLYQNGTAVNSEGETVPIILPKKNNFTLTEGGVESASVDLLNNEYIIKINLVQESVGMYDVPRHNAAAIGYLDVANFDLSFMEVDSADLVYKGSSIELRINADGYVTYASYKIPLHINGSAHKGSISGSASFEGEQSEIWVLNY